MRRVVQWAVAVACLVLPFSAAAQNVPGYGDRIDASLSAAASEAAGDPQKALALVHARTSYEPYRGMLRGARGAFVAGRANSVDQALLLQAVLKPASSRFASCTLSDADAAALAGAAPSQRPALLIEAAGDIAAKVDDRTVKDYLTQLAAAWATLKTTQSEESTALADAVTAAGIDFAGPDTAKLKTEAAAAHVWLQVETDGAWVDLDPTLDPVKPGATRCAPAAYFETLPPDLRHRIAVDVVVELRLATGGQERRTLLHHEVDAADLAFDDTLLFFAEAQGRKTDADAAAVKTGAFSYTPVLRIGAAETAGTPFLAAAPKSGFGSVGDTAGKAVGGATDLIGGMGKPPAEPDPATEPTRPVLPEEPVAAFVELTVSSPGQLPATASATLFDRLGAAARAGGDPAAPLRDLVETDGDYADLTTIWAVGVLTGPVGVREKLDTKAIASGDTTERATGLTASLRGFELLEAALLKTSALEPLSTYLRPRLLLMGLGVTGQGGDAKVAMMADLAGNGIEDAPDAAETVTQRAGRAVARVLAERIVAGAARLPLVGNTALPPVEIDGDMVALAEAARDQGLTLAKGDAAFEDADANALAAAHVAAGRFVLLPPGSVDVNGKRTSGWWVADAGTGLLYDELGNGRSAESVEYTETGEPARQSLPAWRRYGCTIKSVVMAASIVVGLVTFEVDPSALARNNPFLNLAEDIHNAERAAEEAAEEAARSSGQGTSGGC